MDASRQQGSVKSHTDVATAELFAAPEQIEGLKREAGELPSWDLSPRQICDLELLMNGGFAPLNGFLREADYHSVCDTMRLESGALWPMPVTLDVSAEFADRARAAGRIALRDAEGVLLALMDVESVWRPDKTREAQAVFGTTDVAHPGVRYLFDTAGEVYLGGRVIGIQPPVHYDFHHLRADRALCIHPAQGA
ncbi:hypothetical protein [Dichotomicrobium thermohalophilum]|uniref:PUA domain-containing protein n=1 Tax=Dichotomicrobium thermohalophilum TaxID=933063 RepID=A0A397Q3D1_9HYPH|nr:hypothetical protein [Dichotomicrobium thermohalophilum]RIA56030.1 PUA domain-containing protein [Dichotomicrobium thermohalophilum]